MPGVPFGFPFCLLRQSKALARATMPSFERFFVLRAEIFPRAPVVSTCFLIIC
jgi:hypothetical protein